MSTYLFLANIVPDAGAPVSKHSEHGHELGEYLPMVQLAWFLAGFLAISSYILAYIVPDAGEPVSEQAQ